MCKPVSNVSRYSYCKKPESCCRLMASIHCGEIMLAGNHVSGSNSCSPFG